MSGGKDERAPVPVDEQTRIQGVVAHVEGIPFYQAEIEVKGRVRDFVVRESFAIDHEDGEIEVEVDSRTALLPQRSIEGDFGDLLDDPLTDLLMDAAPGDHVHAKIRGNMVKSGNHITVLGIPTMGNQADGSYREAPSKRIVRIRAAAIALGEEGDKLIDTWQVEEERRLAKEARSKGHNSKPATKKKPKADPLAPSKRPLLMLWICVGISSLCLAWAAKDGLPTPYVEHSGFYTHPLLWIWGTTYMGLSAFVWRRRRWMPQFQKVDSGDSGKGLRWSAGFTLMMVTLGLLMIIIPLAMAPQLGYWPAAALCLYFPFMILWKDQKNANKALTLLRAKPLPPDLPDKRFGSIEGSFAGKLDYKRNHEHHSSTRTVTRTDSNGNSYQAQETTTWVTWTENTSSSGDTSLTTDGEEEIALELRHAEWAHGDYHIEYPNPGQGFSALAKHMPKKQARKLGRSMRRGKPRLVSIAKDDHSILAAARVRRGSDGRVSFKASGPGSFLLFTSPPGTSARAALRKELTAHYFGLLISLASVGLPLFFVLR